MRMQRSCPSLGDYSVTSSTQNGVSGPAKPLSRSSRNTSHHPLLGTISSSSGGGSGKGVWGGACSPLYAQFWRKPSQRVVLLLALLFVAASMLSSFHLLLGSQDGSRSHASQPPTLRLAHGRSGTGRAHLAEVDKPLPLQQLRFSRGDLQHQGLIGSQQQVQEHTALRNHVKMPEYERTATAPQQQQKHQGAVEQRARDQQDGTLADVEQFQDPVMWYGVAAASSSKGQQRQQQLQQQRGVEASRADGHLIQLQGQLLNKQHRLAASLEANHKPPAGAVAAAAPTARDDDSLEQQQQKQQHPDTHSHDNAEKHQSAGDSTKSTAADASSSASKSTPISTTMSHYFTSDLASEDAISSYITSRRVSPTRLQYPVWWHGPIWSGSGYGSEANNYVLSLLRTGRLVPGDVWVAHHGDAWRENVVEAFSPEDRADLSYLESLPDKYREKNRPAVVVCHSVPTNWAFPEPMWSAGAPCPPHPHEYGWVYSIGRTMFETDRLPAVFVPRLNAMNEIWVPSQWQKDSFIASGVIPEKLVVVPEGVNTTLYDPEQYTPLDLENVAQLVFGKSWQEKEAKRGEQQDGAQQQQEEERKSKAGRNLAAAEVDSTQQQQQAAKKKFTFISSFKWEQRKGWDILLQAYLSEFTVEDDVELYILTKPYEGSGSGFKEKMRSWADRMYGSHSSIANAREQARLQGRWPAPTTGGSTGKVAAALGTTPQGKSAIAALLPKKGQLLERRKRTLQHWQQQGSASPETLLDSSSSCARRTNCSSSCTAASHMHEQQQRLESIEGGSYQQHVQRVIQDMKQFVARGLVAGQQQQHLPNRRLHSAGAQIEQAVATMMQKADRQQKDTSSQASSSGDVEADISASAEHEAADYPTLYVVDSHISDADFPRFYKAGDAFVLPSRGEGWGRPHVEAMSMGLPIISTNWSGITAYLDESVGYPIAVEKLVQVQGGSEVVWWFRGQRWAQPSVQHLRKLLRQVYSNRTEAAERGAAARRLMVEKYSPEPIADILVKELKRVEGLIP